MDTRDPTMTMVTLQDLLEADAVLPEQFFTPRGSTQSSGERALMWAVFADGIENYRRYAHATTTAGKVAFLEAETWIFQNDWNWPFSFVNLCTVFGFDPAGVRRALLRWRRAHQRPLVRRQRFRPAALRAA